MTLCGTSLAVDSRFGELPANPISTVEVAGVAAEICRDHVFDPSNAGRTLPAGYRFVSIAESAVTEATHAAFLLANPRRGHYAISSLCFLAFDTMKVDEAPMQFGKHLQTAFWWASARGPRHADMRGKSEWVQIGSWYSSKSDNREQILKADPMAEFVDVEISQSQPDAWRLRLVLPTETVVADIKVSGQRRRSNAAQPSFITVPMSGASANYFSVFTYFGHQHRSAEGIWRATGSGLFRDAFATQNDSSMFRTVFQENWSSKSGLYRFAAP